MHFPLSLSRRHLLAMLAGPAVLPLDTFAQAGRTVRVIVNTSAGAGIDGNARTLQPALGQALGASVVVENMPGASGLIGLQTLARAPADGSTIGFATSNLVILPNVLKSVPYDVTTDFSPIAIFGEMPLVLVANPAKIQATNAKEFVAALKSKPEAYNYGSSGSGTILHLATEMLLQGVGLGIKHIPYKATTPMLMDTISGQVDFATAALPTVIPHIKSGALRAIGLCTAQRFALTPEIPTFVEQGFPNVVVQSWHSVLGPKGMPAALVKKYHDAVVLALKDGAMRDALEKQATVLRIQTPEEAQATIRADLARYATLVKQIGLQPQ